MGGARMGEGKGVVRQAGLSANPTFTTWLRVEPYARWFLPCPVWQSVPQPQQQRHHYDHIATTEAAAKEHAVLGMMILPECEC
ncbi:hypothetical protein E2C01_094442 [Portunus trituberculatus]|uniref:Uncharacterized protein n=1 Tax=Portunus trituberculatus TaxID=210409 RepID=A0A5B7K1N5_PORTR|nr:hypothetical protein [Portunus trituberculatus]